MRQIDFLQKNKKQISKGTKITKFTTKNTRYEKAELVALEEMKRVEGKDALFE